MSVVERIEITGVVQGVGFRPFVHRLAGELGLDGHVGNDSSRVFIEVSGSSEVLDRFVERLHTDAPPLARIERVERVQRVGAADRGFHIVESRSVAGRRTLVPPDTALCTDCARELFDPSDRRFHHPFITCTNCGPRFTIIESLPYDRDNTTMAGFEMCSACRSEYGDPNDRRYHAQPIACHDCGPELAFHSPIPAIGDDPVERAIAALAAGGVVAIKGLGGYHLACDATDDVAVTSIRTRKHRPDKPLAIMVADLAHAEEYAFVSEAEAELLCSSAAPIVLLRARSESSLSSLIAPGNPLIGVMLAYTPVHQLLLAGRRSPLVMTSANRAGEPIAYRPEHIGSLVAMFDAVLDNDRPISAPCDDSVVRLVGGRLLPIRRARGYAPLPVPFAATTRSVLAVGAESKNAFCVTTGGHAWLSQHIGDMENLETLRAFEGNVGRFVEMYDVHPDVVAVDAHPGYLSSKAGRTWARQHRVHAVREVQHHHAHIAAVMAEHQLDPHDPVIGFAFDGTGYGDDGSIWGGEMLIADAKGYDRVAHLASISLPGGDAAIREPCRVALAHLHGAGLDWDPWLAPVQEFTAIELGVLRQQLVRDVACVATTSMGRFFDAVASLLGLRQRISFEAQAAIELEIVAEDAARHHQTLEGYRFDLDDGTIVTTPVPRRIVADLDSGSDVGTIAWHFHDAVAEIVARLAMEARDTRGIATVALSGGTFQNALLTRLCVERLDEAGFTALTHHLVPPNDGGLALGQAYIAAHSTNEFRS